jgi:hypothetical protein
MTKRITIYEKDFDLHLTSTDEWESVVIRFAKEKFKDDIQQIIDIYGKNLIAAIINKMLLFIEDYNQRTQGTIASAVNTRNAMINERRKQKKRIKGGEKIPKEQMVDIPKVIEPKGIPIWTYGYISQLFGGFFKESVSGSQGSDLYSQTMSLSPHGIRTAEHRPPYYEGTTGIGESYANAFVQMQNTGWGNMMRIGFHFPSGGEMRLKNSYGYFIERHGWEHWKTGVLATVHYNITQVLKEMWEDIESCSLRTLFNREIVDKLIASGRFKPQRKKYIE